MITKLFPKERSVDFGSLQRPINLNVFYNGKENDQYKNMMGTFSMNYKPSDKWRFTLDSFAYQNREKEYYTIASSYILQTFDPLQETLLHLMMLADK